jgi:hypothetical protein
MGLRPSKRHSLDRINNDKNYRKSNCQWSPRWRQANNNRHNHIVKYRGRKMSIAEAARLAGNVVTNEIAANRINHGWNVERAVKTPRKFIRSKQAWNR